MKWRIVEQEERIGKNLFMVRCKRLRFFPQDNGQEVTFGRIQFPLFQVIIQNEIGEQVRLKLNGYSGLANPKFILKQADRLEYQTITVGEGKRRKEVPDVLKPKELVKGISEEHNQATFEKRLEKMVGAILKEEIMTLFANKIGQVMAKAA